MGEKIKTYWEKVKEVLGKVSKKVWIALAAVLVVVIAAIVIVVASNNEYTILFTNLSNSDVSSIVSYLKEQGITDYKLENGDTIKVPKNQVEQLQMQVILDGYDSSGFAYDLYMEKIGALSTQSERDTILLMAMEEKLRACIVTLDNVVDAQVNLTPGEDHSYVLDSNNKVNASASVLVEMRSGKMLTDQQADAIRRLVSGKVQGLEVDSVEVLDTTGNVYAISDDWSNISDDSSERKLILEEKYNNLIRTSVMQVLSPFYGVNNVKISVNCTVDVNRMTQASTEINMPDWATNGEGIIGSKIYDDYIVRSEDENVGGEVGTESNAALPDYVEGEMQTNGSETEVGTSGQIDYVNPTTETYLERTAGYLTDCMVSVSINTASLSEEEIANLTLHVARAAGISDEYAASKISIYPGLFYVEPIAQEPGSATMSEMQWFILLGVGALILLLLLIIMISSSIRRKKRKKKEEELINSVQQQALEQMMESMPDMEEISADVMNIRNEKSMELRKDIRRFADESPEIAAQIVRNLLRGGENDG